MQPLAPHPLSLGAPQLLHELLQGPPHCFRVQVCRCWGDGRSWGGRLGPGAEPTSGFSEEVTREAREGRGPPEITQQDGVFVHLFGDLMLLKTH